MQYKKIKKIQPTKKEDIYHLTVEKNHNFFGNGVCLHNCSYRGDCGILLYNLSKEDYQVKKGDRIAQFVIYPLIKFPMEFTEKKQETERGSKGFGSSGK